MRSLSLSLFVCAVSLLFSTSANAQEFAKTDDDTKVAVGNAIQGFFGESMQVQLTEMATNLIDGYLDYLAKPQTTKKLAIFQKNYYDALIEQGFTKDQSFELLLKFGNPLSDGPHAGK